MDNDNSQTVTNVEANRILKEYREKSDKIVRKMIGVLVEIHKKIDEASYKEWKSKIDIRT